MNKIFKVIWNHSTQSWVAVSELNRAKGKTKSTSAAKVAAAVAALGLVSISGNVLAAKVDNAQNPTGTTQNGNLVIGADTDVFSNTILQGGMPTKDDDTFLVNAGSQWETDKSQVQDQAANPKNTVIGAGAQVKRALSIAQGESVVVGNSAVAKTAQAVVIGAGADSGNIDGGVTIGYQATSDQRWTTVGHTRYDNPHNAQASIKAISGGKETAAIGEGDAKNRVLSSGVAVGRHANSQGGGVALGDKARALTGDEEGNPIVNKLGRGLGVAIGSYALSHSGGVAIGAAVEATGLNSMAFGRQAAAKGGSSIAVGSASAAVGKNAISMGHSATSLGDRSIAIGASQSQEKYDATNNTVSTGNDSIAMGSKARSIGTESTSIGFNSTANGNNTVAIGSNARVNDNIDLTAEQRNKYYPYYQDWLNWFNEDPSRKDDPANAKNWAWVQSAINGFMHAAENSVAVGNNAQVLAGVATANGGYEGLTTGGATAIGHNAQTAFGASVAVGSARANAVNSIAIGAFGIHKGSGRDFAAETRSDGSLAVGNLAFVNTQSSGGQAIGRGASVLTNSSGAVALGQSAVAQGAGAVAIGGAAVETKEEEDGVLPRGSSAVAGATNSVALSANSKVYQGSDASIAIGYGSAVGEGAVEQDADPNIPPTAVTSTTTAVKAVALGAETKVLGNSSAAVGSTNKVTTENTFVLGSGVNMKADGSAALSGTVANSVYLGADSHAVAGTAVGTKNKTSEDAEGTTTTAGDKGAVASATVGGQTYGGFAGATANGVVSVGAAGSERRIQNVAAGEISSTSTDAINGSQLYAVGDNLNNLARTTATALGTTVNSNGTLVAPTYTVTNNPSGANVSVNNVKDAVENLTTAVSRPLTFAANMGTALERKLGTTLNVKGANSNVDGITRNTDTATSGSYSAKNIQTFVDTDGIQIQMAENPEFTSVIVPTAGANNVIINNNGINAGNKPITNVNNGLGSYTGAPNSTNPKGGLVNLDIPAGAAPTVANSTVATVGDLRNMGWIVESNKTTGTTAGATTDAAYTAQVKNAQQVKFVGTGEATVSGKTENGVNTITVHVAKPAKPETTALQIGTSTNTAGNDGTTQATTEQGKVVTPQGDNANKLVKAGDIANAINQSGFNVKSGGNKAADDQADATLINPGEEVTFTAGKNLTVKRVDNEFTFATDENVTFTNVNTTTLSVGAPNVADKPAVNFTTEKAKPATNNPTNNAPATALNLSTGAGNDSKPVQITGVGSTLNTQAIDTNPDAKGNTPAVPANLVNLTENSVNPNSAATVGDLQNMGWVVSTKGDGYKDVVKNANEIQFVGKNGVSVTGETVGDIRTITVDVNAQNVANNAQLPVVYTKADGTKVALNPADNKFYPAKADGTPDTTQPEVAKADVIASLNNGGNSSTAPTSLANVKGNLAPTYNVGDMEIVNGKPNTTAQTTPTKAATAPTAAEAAKMYNNAATVGDVLNTGWNLQGNGEAVDFVKPYDTVNFVNGTGTTVEVKADADGKVNTIKVNTLTSLVDKDGNPVIQVGDKFYKTEDIDPATGKPLAGKNPIDTAANPINVNMVNPTAPTSSTTTPVQLGNVAAGAGTKDIATKPTGVENTAPTNVKFADLEKAPNTNVLTVADAKNMGWVVSAGNDYSDAVKNTNEVKFVGTGLANVTGVTQGDIRTISVHVDAQKVAEAAQLPVVYTDAAGNKLIKGKDAADQDVFYPDSVTLGADGKPTSPADYAKAVQPANVIASMNSGGDSTTAPTQLANVKGNLNPTYNKGDMEIVDGKPTATAQTAPTKEQAAPTAAEAAKMYNNAATVGDVLNAGFNLQGNGKAVDFVKPYDTVNFVNGVGTTVNVVAADDGKVSSIQVNGLVGVTDKNGDTLVKANDGKYYKPADVVNGAPVASATPVDAADTVVNLINPNSNDPSKAGDAVQLGNIAAGAQTFDAPQNAANEPLKLANDGKWYKAGDVKADGTTVAGATVEVPAFTANNKTGGLIDFAKSNPSNALTVADAQNMGWVVSSDKTTGALGDAYSDQVRNANEVKFVGTGLATVSGQTDVAIGIRTITVDVDAQKTVEAAQLPVVYTDAAGNKLIKGKDAADQNVFYPDNVTLGADGKPTSPADYAKAVQPANVIASMNSGDNSTTAPTQLANVKGNLNPTYNVSDNKIGADGKPDGTTIDAATGPTKSQTAPAATDVAKMYNNAATVGDVLNAGFNLQGNGQAVDFVKPYDTVNFVNGVGTTVEVKADADGKVSSIQVNGLVGVTDKNGNTLVKANDGKYYKPADVVNGAPKPGAQEVVAGDTVVNLINPNSTDPSKAGDAVQLGNVAAGAKTFDAPQNAAGNPLKLANDGKWYKAGDVKADGTTVAGATVEVPAFTANNKTGGLIDFAKSNPSNALTVADAQNMGWVVSADGNKYSDQVRNANEVKFVGGTGINVTGETKDGVREINISLKTGNVTGGNSGATGDDGFVTGTKVADAINNSGWNIGKNTDTSGLTFGDTVADSLVNPADSVKFADGKNSEVKFAQTTENGKSVTTVKVNVDVPVDYRYKDSKGNEVVKGDDGKFYAIDPATGLANKASPIDTAANPVTKDGAKLTNGSDPAAPYKQGNVDADKENPVAGTGGVTLGNVAWATQPDQAVNKDQLDQTVNKSGWELQNNGEKRDKVQPNDKVNFINGGNTNLVVATAADGKSSTVQVNVTGLPVTYAAKDNTPVTKVGDKFFTVDANGNPTSTEVKAADLAVNVVNPAAKPNEIGAPTKISNVADGDISPTSKDAVNGSQLYNLQKVVGGNTLDNMTTTPVTITENGQEKEVDVVTSNGYTLTTYNVKGQTNYVTNNVIEAIGRMNEEGIKFFHANDANVDKSKIQKKNEVDSSAAGAYAVAVGYQSEAKGPESLAIGHNSVAAGKQSIAIGTKNTVTGNHSGAIGDPNTVKGNHSYVYGNNNSVETDNTFVLGNNVTTTAENSVFLGANTGYVGVETHSDGSLNEAKARTTAGKAALTKQVTGGVENHYAGGKKEEVVGVVSVGNVGVDANGNVVQQTRRIQNVAPGLISENSTDAINGSQLYSVTAGFDKKLGDVHNKINRNNKNLRAGIAGANAAAGLPQVYLPGKSMVAASAGTFKGQSAVAVGYSRASDNGKLILKLQGNANTRGDFGGSVGIGYQW